MYGDPERPHLGDLRLVFPGPVDGPPVHGHQPEPPPLVEAEGVEVVVTAAEVGI